MCTLFKVYHYLSLLTTLYANLFPCECTADYIYVRLPAWDYYDNM